MSEKLLTVKQLAEKIQWHQMSIYNAMRKGTFFLRPVRIGRSIRFKESDLEAATGE